MATGKSMSAKQSKDLAKTLALEFLRSRPSDLSEEEVMELANKVKKSVRKKSLTAIKLEKGQS